MEEIKKHRGFYIFEGIVFILLGMLAVTIPWLFTLSMELLVGWLFVIGGLVLGYRTLKSRGQSGFWFALLSSILYIVVGGLLLAYPMVGILSITLLLMISFFLQGVFQVIWGFQMRHFRRWGWYVFSGLISLGLAYLIWSGWPGSAIWLIGLLVGVNMLLFGFTQLFIALGAKD